ncbi:MAG: 5-formyltetrahydrofolate cyclo-ligase [Proteobacteria bacterium]|nr:5-formyltetrahydrofolate cyclo-ligase [Pseudomonadota bacterium]MDE3208296.1 5-formyltetrahydrofolate cyclo-ligase [Pseudomonadota bacterium]
MKQHELEKIFAWRKQKRQDYLLRRMQMGSSEHQELNKLITEHLLSAFGFLSNLVTGFCWPYKNEFDSRFFVKSLRDRGGKVALPSVVSLGQPLEFYAWWPGVDMKPGVFEIPVPQGTPQLVPKALLVPPIGFDNQGYRLGYGGAFFDRTLAKIAKDKAMPLKIGVAFDLCHMETIYPLEHDIPMDFIVTESGIYAPMKQGLKRVQPEEVPHAIQSRFTEDELGLAH